MIVTSSISHKNAVSGGVNPGGRGKAMTDLRHGVYAFTRGLEGYFLRNELCARSQKSTWEMKRIGIRRVDAFE